MQYRLSTLLIAMALAGVYFGILNMPTFIAAFLYFAVVLVTPAYWVTGVIFARQERRAFFVGAIAAGAGPYLILGTFGLVLVFEGPWRWGMNRYQFGETQLINMLLSAVVFSPMLLALAGGWIGRSVYRTLKNAPDEADPEAVPQSVVKRPHPLDREIDPVNS